MLGAISSDGLVVRDNQLDQQTRNCLRLWAVVFRGGLLDYARLIKTYRSTKHAAVISSRLHMWFWSDDEGVQSFNWMCRLFDMEPDTARNLFMKRWREIAWRIKDDTLDEG
jgi:hypothetical protein